MSNKAMVVGYVYWHTRLSVHLYMYAVYQCIRKWYTRLSTYPFFRPTNYSVDLYRHARLSIYPLSVKSSKIEYQKNIGFLSKHRIPSIGVPDYIGVPFTGTQCTPAYRHTRLSAYQLIGRP